MKTLTKIALSAAFVASGFIANHGLGPTKIVSNIPYRGNTVNEGVTTLVFDDVRYESRKGPAEVYATGNPDNFQMNESYNIAVKSPAFFGSNRITAYEKND